MILDVVSARHIIRDYELEIEFEDGAKGIVDFSQYRSRGGVFSKFNDIESSIPQFRRGGLRNFRYYF